MVREHITHFALGNGLVLIVQQMPSVQSAAFQFLVPAGASHDPDDREGLSEVLCQLAVRGAGERDNRRFSTDLDNLGVQRSESVGRAHTTYCGATIARNLEPALAIYADLLRRPHLPHDELEPVRLLALQQLQSLEDEPSHKVMLELRRRHYPHPWGRPSEGSAQGLSAITTADVRRHFERCYTPRGTILGVAGNVQPERVRDAVVAVLGDWHGPDEPTVHVGDRGPRRDHVEHKTEQTQIALAIDSVPYRHPDYYVAWAAAAVLGGGSSSRLFMEVRERRGLCYAIDASLNVLRDYGAVLCYAGTTNARAQETLDVMLAEIRRLPHGVTADELERVKAQAKSMLIMQQESSPARAGSLARSWYHLGRVVTLDEVNRKIDAITSDAIRAHLERYAPDQFTLLTLGPEPLEVPSAVS